MKKRKGEYDYIPKGNIRNPDEDKDDEYYVESEQSKELKKLLNKSKFQIAKHKSFANPNVVVFSLLFCKKMEREFLICHRVGDDRLVNKNVALPADNIIDLLPLELNRLEEVKRRVKNEKGVLQPLDQYFTDFVVDFIYDQGTEAIWQENKNPS